ncbi:hypothetical protein KAR48_15525 [bacterium]|nr:hypothetical protein [bacterium]
MMIIKQRFIAILVLVCGVNLLMAQETKRLLTDRLFSTGANFSTWTVGGDNVTQFSFPMAYRMPIGQDGQFYVSTSPALSSLGVDSLSYSLNGLSDIRMGGNVFLFNQNWLLTYGLNLPTGKSSLNIEQFQVWKELIQPAFSFPVSSYGQGMDVNIGISTAYELGGLMLGAGLAYLYKGSFAPLEGSSLKYDAGDELIFTVAIQKDNLMADVMITYYGKDKLDKVEIFQSGLTYLFQLAGNWTFDQWQLNILLREQFKANNKLGIGSAMITERKSLNGNQFAFHALASRPMQSRLDLLTSWVLRIYSNNDYGWGGSTFTGPGLGINYGIGDNMSLKLLVNMLFGKINTLAGSFSASGLTGKAGITVVL